MTPALFDLPLRLGDAATLADMLLEVLGAGPKPATDEQRRRAAARASGFTFSHLTPHIASLERDPVHPAACYVCVDGVEDQPLLLRAAPATSPSSGLFPKAILIGRTHIHVRELVLNAVPFGPADCDRIAVFAQQVNQAFLPRPAASRSLILPKGEDPAAFCFEVIWSAIRSGDREGFTLRGPSHISIPGLKRRPFEPEL